MDYVGYHRIGFKWTLIFAICLLIFGFGCYMAFDDATYHELVESGRKRLLDHLPRPALQVLMATIMAGLIVGIPVKVHAVLAKKISFAIRADGIHTWPILFRKPGFMAWDDVRTVMRVKDTLTFKGRGGKGGNEASIAFTLIGHSRKKVLAAIAQFRPDIAEALK